MQRFSVPSVHDCSRSLSVAYLRLCTLIPDCSFPARSFPAVLELCMLAVVVTLSCGVAQCAVVVVVVIVVLVVVMVAAATLTLLL